MPAIIPDDWDGTTFECKRVIWPSSKKWAAILLGQMTEPTVEAYWDGETEARVDASFAVQTAYRQTIPDIYNLGCDDLTNLPATAFKVVIDGTQAIAATTWTEIIWETYLYNHNDTGFDLGDFGHLPVSQQKKGLWHYDASLQVVAIPGVWYARAIIEETGQILANVQASGQFVDLSFPHVWGNVDNTLRIETWGVAAMVISDTPGNTWWSGDYIGPVVLP